jgi:hypothetical protein
MVYHLYVVPNSLDPAMELTFCRGLPVRAGDPDHDAANRPHSGSLDLFVDIIGDDKAVEPGDAAKPLLSEQIAANTATAPLRQLLHEMEGPVVVHMRDRLGQGTAIGILDLDPEPGPEHVPERVGEADAAEAMGLAEPAVNKGFPRTGDAEQGDDLSHQVAITVQSRLFDIDEIVPEPEVRRISTETVTVPEGTV